MALEVWFWLGMAIWFLFGAYPFVRGSEGRAWPVMGGSLMPWICVFILGWSHFGSPVQG